MKGQEKRSRSAGYASAHRSANERVRRISRHPHDKTAANGLSTTTITLLRQSPPCRETHTWISLRAHISPSSGLISKISSANSIRSFPSALRKWRYLRFKAACAAWKLGGSSTNTLLDFPSRPSPEDATTVPLVHSSW